MTIDDLIPDDKEVNVGGRPPTSGSNKEDDDKRNVEGKPFTIDSDSKEWWHNAMEECLGYRKFPYNDSEQIRAINKLSDFTFLFPVEVRVQLDEHDIFETDWKEYLAHRPHLFGDARLPEKWRKRTDGMIYSMSDKTEIDNGDRKPFYRELEDPDKFRSSSSSGWSPGSSRTDPPKDGAFSDLIEDA